MILPDLLLLSITNYSKKLLVVPGVGIAYNSRWLPPARSQAAPRGAPRHLARRASLRSSTPHRAQSSLRAPGTRKGVGEKRKVSPV
jgi:hypothetical protein